MPKISAQPKTQKLVKIGDAANILGVSIDTLRRWEKKGKIQAIRTPGGTRLYNVKRLKNFLQAPQVPHISSVSPREAEITERKEEAEINFQNETLESNNISEILDRVESAPLKETFQTTTTFYADPIDQKESSILEKINDSFSNTSDNVSQYIQSVSHYLPNYRLFLSAFGFSFTVSALVTVLWLWTPQSVVQPLSSKDIQNISKGTQMEQLGRLALDGLKGVLAASSSAGFLEINSDLHLNGSLNGLSIKSDDNSSLSVTNGDIALDQTLTASSSPTFSSLNLSSTQNQLIFQSGGPTGTLTWTPTAARIITLPDATTTLTGTDTTQTITNKTISGSSNTLTDIPNSALTNHKITISPGTNLTGGGDVELGSSITLSMKSSPAITGVLSLPDGTAAAPSLTFTDDTDTGLYRIGANKIGLITAGTATSGITIDANGNVGIGTITPTTTLHVVGTGNITSNTTIGGTLGVTAATTLSSTLAVTGDTTITGDLTVNGGDLTTTATTFNLVNATATTLNIGGAATTLSLGASTGTTTINNATTALTGVLNVNGTGNSYITGNLGIGSTSPVSKLEVIGTANVTSTLTASNGLTLSTGALNLTSTSGSVNLALDQSTTAFKINNLFNIDTTNQRVGIGTTAPINKLDVIGSTYISGNVGIGTSSPNYKLEVVGTNNVTGAATFGSTGSFASTLTAQNGLTLTTGALNLTSTSGTVGLTLSSSSTAFNIQSGLFDIDTASSRVGIGTATPQNKLDVSGAVAIGTYAGTNTAPSNGLIVSGNVGIGISSPQSALHIGGITTVNDKILPAYGSIDIGSSAIRFGTGYFDTINATNLAGVITGGSTTSSDWTINSDNATADTEDASLTFERGSITPNAVFGWDSTNKEFDLNGGLHITDTITPTGSQTLLNLTYAGTGAAFRINDDGTSADPTPFLIDSNGNVGIGTSTPGSSLQINGSAVIGYGGAPFAAPSQGLVVSGNVGIGTSNPATILDVQGNSSSALELARFQNTGSNDQGYIFFPRPSDTTRGLLIGHQVDPNTVANASWIRAAGGVSQHIEIQTGLDGSSARGQLHLQPYGGNIGIQTSSPAGLLDIANNFVVKSGGNVGVGTSSPTQQFQVNPSGANALVMTSGGNLGIGTTSPQNKLEVIGNTNLVGTLTVSGATTLSSTLSLADGSAATPALNFTNDTDSGLWRIGANQIALTTGGGTNNGLSINSSGNVGIGTTNATSKLQIIGSTSDSTASSLNITDSGSNSWLNVRNDGYVSVGTTTFVGAGNAGDINFTVNSPTRVAAINLNAAAGKGAMFQAYEDGTRKGYIEWDAGNTPGILTINANRSGASSNRIDLNPGSVIALSALSTGNIGIGTSTPGTKLAVAGGGLFGYTGTQSLSSGASLGVLGNVGIGTSSPDFTLQVAGTTNISSNLTVGGNLTVAGSQTFSGQLQLADGSNASPSLAFTNDTNTGLYRVGTDSLGFVTGGLDRMSINASGNVGIGTTNAGALLQVGSSSNTTATGGLNFGGDVSLYRSAANILRLDDSLEINNNAVAIGGNAYTANLELIDSSTSVVTQLALHNNVTSNGGSKIAFISRDSGSNVGDTASIYTSDGAHTAGAYIGSLRLATTLGNSTLSTSTTDRLVIEYGTATAANAYFTNIGNFGIGTAAPKNKLDVAGAGVFGTTYAGVSTAPTNGLLVQGNVGIGTSTPGSALQVNGSGVFGFGGAPFAAPTNGLLVGGNVGIGTSTPGTAKLAVLGGNVGIGTSSPDFTLQVAGTTNISSNLTVGGNLTVAGSQTFSGQLQLADGSNASPSLAFTNDTNTGLYRIDSDRMSFVTGGASALTINGSGNVGVGTTSPIAKLHVEGQCVTGDTKLKRRRRRKGKNGEWIEDWEDVRIDQIQEGDEILTLDQHTGNFAVQKVNALKDMDIQDVFELVTETGKTIQTTANHPYLVDITNEQHVDLNSIQKETFEYSEKLAKQFYINHLAGRKIKSKGLKDTVLFTHSGWNHFVEKSRSLNELMTRFFALSRAASVLKNSPRVSSYKKIKKADITVEYWELQEIIESVLVKVLVSAIDNGQKFFLSCNWLGTKSEEGIMANKKELSLSPRVEKSTQLGRRRELVIPQLFSKIIIPDAVKWIKVKELHVGKRIATIDGWETIVSITPKGRKQTYDIEIDQTHNFVGNGIVAHNTYIHGNLGIGSSNPGANLQIGGNATIGYGEGTATQGQTLAVAGNLGVGTSSPNYKLEVVGTQHTTGAATFDSTGSFASTLTASNGLTLSTGALNLTSTSGSVALTLSSATNAFNVQSGLFDIDTQNSRVGIGTATPSNKLDVNGAVAIGSYAGGSPTAPTNGLIVSGNVGIGVSIPTAALHVNGNGIFGYGNGPLTAPTGGLLVSGNTGIGTSSPNAKLEVLGNLLFTSGTTRTISVADAPTNTTGSQLSITGALGNGSGAGGAIAMTAGAGGASGTGTGGAITITGGLGGVTGVTSAGGGAVSITAGASDNTANATGGALSLAGGAGSGAQAGGAVTIAGGAGRTSTAGGDGSGGGGAVTIRGGHATSAAGTGGTGGALSLAGGNATNGNDTGKAGGAVNITGGSGGGTTAGAGGALVLTGGTPSATGAGGAISLTTGAGGSSSGVSGALTLATGTTTSGNTGALTLRTGAVTGGTAGNILFQTNGSTNRMSIDTNGVAIGSTYANASPLAPSNGLIVQGNVGIGTSTPGTNLQINGSAAIGYGGAPVSSGLTAALAINGNVGIGVSNPGAKLAVAGGGLFGYNGTQNLSSGASLGVLGNVGIGTSSPNYTLEVVGTTNITGNTTIGGSLTVAGSQSFSGALSLSDGSATTPALNFTNDTDSGLWRIGANQIALTTNGQSHNGLSINSSGNVGIGTTNATANLDVVNTNISNGGVLTNLNGTLKTASSNGTGYGLNISITNSNTTNADTAYGILSTIDDSTALANNVYAGYFDARKTLGGAGNSSLTLTGVYGQSRPINNGTTTTYGTAIGGDFLTTLQNISNQTVTNAYGVRGQVNGGSGLSTVTNLYGGYFNANTGGGGGATPSNMYGVYIANPASGGFVSGNKTGLYVAAQTGGDTNYAAIFAGGNVGISTASPVGLLDVANNFVVKSGGNVGIGTSAPNYKLEVVGTGSFSSTLSLANGSATTPALNFTNDTNSGLWSIGADQIALTTGGINTNGISINSSGNVGIGTTNATGVLQVIGGAGTAAPISLTAGSGSGSGTGGAVSLTGGSGGTTSGAVGGALTLTGGAGTGTGQGGNVGITGGNSGTSAGSTGGAVNIAGGTNNSGVGGAISITGGAAGASGTGRAGGAISITTGGASVTGTSGTLTLNTAVGTNAGSSAGGASGAISIASLGGGTTSSGTNGGASGSLTLATGNGGASTSTIGGAGGAIAITAGNGGNGGASSGAAGTLTLTSGSAGTGGNVNGGNITLQTGTASGTGLAGSIVFNTSGSNSKMTITGAGNVGIGTSTPGTTLQIAGNAMIGFGAAPAVNSATNGLVVGGNVGIGTSIASNRLSVVGGNIDLFGGNLGIGTSSPGAQLAVAGGGLFGYSGTQSLSSGASLGVLGNVGIGTTSPNYTLEVVGTTNITGNTTIGGSLTVAGSQSFSGQLQLADGSNAAPSLAFVNDTDTGLFRFGTNGVALTTAGSGVNLLSLNANGNVGIGNTNPVAKLDIAVSDATTNTATTMFNIRHYSSGTTTTGFGTSLGFQLQNPSGTLQTTNLVTSSWDTNSTQSKLTITGNYNGSAVDVAYFGTRAISGTPGYLSIYSGSTNGQIGFSGGNGDILLGSGGVYASSVRQMLYETATSGNITNLQGYNGINFKNQSAGRTDMVIDNNGNVGIGTTGPTNKLSVLGTADIFGGNLGIGTSTPGAKLAVAGGGLFGYSGTQALSSGASLGVLGNVGIGTTSPNYKLEVVGTTNITGNTSIGGNLTVTGSQTFSGQLQLADGSNSSPALAFTNDIDTGLFRFGTNGLALTTAGSGVNLLSLDSAGNVGIGTTNATAKLQINDGGINITNNQDATAPQLNLRYNGTTAVSEAINFYNGANLKHSVGNYTGNSDFFIDSYTSAAVKKTPLTANADNLLILLDPNGESWKVGIGTNAPNAKLGISGNVAIGSSYATVVAPTDGLAVQGNVGIGTSSPNYKLEVVGTTNITGNATFGGILQLADGSNGVPSLAFTNDTNTGLYRIDSDRVSLVTGGASALTINSSGNVGIGTTNATAKLEVLGNLLFTSGATRTISVADQGSSNTAGSQLSITGAAGNGTGAGGAIAITGGTGGGGSGATGGAVNITSGAAGAQGGSGGITLQIGTPASAWPAGALQLLGANGQGTNGIGTTITMTAGNSNDAQTGGAINITAGGSAAGTAGAITLTGGAGNIGGLLTGTGGAITLTTGVGGTNSGASGALTLATGTTSSGRSGDITIRSGAATGGNAGDIFFQTNGANNRMTIAYGGNVGIGTSTPGSLLQVATGGTFGFGGAPITAPSNGLAIFGNVGIGTTSPNYTLEVVGTTNITGALTVGGATSFAGTISPSLDDTYDLGTSALRWRDLYLGPSSLNLVSTAAETTTARNWKVGIEENGSNEGNLRIALTGSPDALTINPSGNVGIGTTNPTGVLHVVGAAGTGAPITMTAGSGTATGTGGAISLTSGAGGSTSGASGALTLAVGTPISGNGGAINLTGAAGVGGNNTGTTITLSAGASAGSGTGGAVNITAGATSGDSANNYTGGAVNITGGTAAGFANIGGAVVIKGGPATRGKSGTGASGGITILSGTTLADVGNENGADSGSWTGGTSAGSGTTTAGRPGGVSGNVSLSSGTGGTTTTGNAGAAGSVSITGGNGGAASSSGTGGAGGALTLTAGTGGASTSGTGGAGGALTLISGSAGSGGNVNGGALTLRTGTATGTGTVGNILFQTNGSTNRMSIDTNGVAIGSTYANASPLAPSNGLIVSGNVGIGTSVPNTKLDVIGNGTYAADFMNGNVGIGTSTPSQLFQINPNGTSAFVVTLAGNVGIGTTSPIGLLHVAASTATANGAGIILNGQTGGGATSNGGAITLVGGNAQGGAGIAGAISLTAGVSGTNGTSAAINLTGGQAGGGASSVAGAVNITGGAANGVNSGSTPGAVNITGGSNAGAGNTAGGAITIAGGAAKNSGAGGAISITTGAGASTGNSGNLTLGTGTVSTGSFGTISLDQGANIRLRIDTNGNVGIGTSTPAHPLAVVGANDDTPILTLSNSAGDAASWQFTRSSTTGALSLQGTQSGFNNIVLAPTSGNVGIGTATPVGMLGISMDNSTDTTNQYGMYINRSSSSTTTTTNVYGIKVNTLDYGVGHTTTNAYGLYVGSGYGTSAYGIYVDTQGGGNPYGIFQTSASNPNYFAGNIGVGTSNPSGKLEIKGTNPISYITDTSTGYAALELRNNSSLLEIGQENSTGGTFGTGSLANAGVVTMYNNNALQFGTNNTIRMTIAAAGNVGVGTASPVAKLNLFGTGASTGVNLLTQSSAGAFGLAVLDNGNVGIGTTAPANQLDIFKNGNRGLSFDTSTLTINGTSGIAQPILTFGFDGSARVTASSTAAGQFELNYPAEGASLTLVAGGTPTIQSNVAGRSLAFTAGGTVERMRLDSNGNLGIGTSSPGSQLAVANNATIGYGNNPIAPTNGLAVNGNVGIGVTSTSAKLHVLANASTGTGVLFDNNQLSTGNQFLLQSTSTAFSSGNLASIDWTPGASTTATGDLFRINIGANGNAGNLLNILDGGSSIFSVSETAVTTSLPTNFTAAGDVAIAYDLNFTNPTASYIKSAAPLNIVAGETFGSSNLTLQTYNSGQLVFDLAGGAAFNQAQNWTLANSTNALNILSSTGSPILGLDGANGNVGIGTSIPRTRLDVIGNGTYAADFMAGNVGIGTSTPTAPLEVKAGGTGTIAKFTSNNTTGCTLADGGTISCSSDQTLKKNIDNLPYGLDDVMKLRPVEFNWKTESDSTVKSLGFIAQEVESIIPKLVRTDENGLKELNTIGLVPLLTRSIQEQQGQIASQSAQIATASAQLAALQTSLANGLTTNQVVIGNATIASVSGKLNIAFGGQNVMQVDSVGNLTLAGTITSQASGFDVAENYPTDDQTIEAGDVVAITKTGGAIEKTTTPYQKNAIGIITTKPGLTLTSKSVEGKDVALAGRVPVKVTTENGEIKAGDSLTTSSIPGYAMKATQPGTVIGKAFEDFPTKGTNGTQGTKETNDPSVSSGSSVSSETFVQGKIMTFINISWYDPTIYFAKDGTIAPVILSNAKDLDSSASPQNDITINASQSAVASTSATLNSQLSTLNLNDDPTFKDLITKYDQLASRLDTLQSVVIGTDSAQLASSSAVILNSFQDLASPSAELAGMLNQVQHDMGINGISINASGSATITGDLTVSGRTTLNDLGVTGTISAGMLAIDGFESSINTLSGDLKLQNLALGGIDILNGKIVIDTKGNITTVATVKAKEIEAEKVTTNKLVISEPASNAASQSAVLSASVSATPTPIGSGPTASPSAAPILASSVGTATIKAGKTTIEVKTSAITDGSLVFVTADQPIATSGKVQNDNTILISIPKPTPKDIKVNWWIVDKR